MKNKVVTIICAVLIIIAIVCFGYIFINSKTKEKKQEENKNEVVDNVDNPEVVEREERGQNVNVNSRIGLELKELIKYSEIYSNDIIDKLDQVGVDSQSKLLVILDKIYRTPEYQQYLQYSDEYNTTYILPENINTILSDVFADNIITTKQVEGILNFDTSTNSYVVVSRAFQTGSIGYTLEIPYKITEYSDRVELLAYRVYITKKIEMDQVESTVNSELYYDKEKSLLAISINDDPEFTEASQIDYIKNKIDSGVINANNLSSVKYTFIKLGGKYKIKEFENIK